MEKRGLIILLLLCTSCGLLKPKIEVHTQIVYRDSTIIKETIKDTTIYVPIPLESNQVVVNMDEKSFLETSLAKSEAYVGEDGLLHHTLENKKGSIPVTVPIRGKFIYTNVSLNKSESLIKYVEKKLTWWQSTKIEAFWWLLGLVLVQGLWIFRKPLKRLIP